MFRLKLRLRWPACQDVCVQIPGRTVSLDGTITIDGMFDDCHRVPDVDRYVVSCDGDRQLLCHVGTDGFSRSKYNDKEPEGCHDNIVVLLESPHSKEYSKANRKIAPIAPAQNKTGKQIKDHLSEYLKHPPEANSYIRDNSGGSHIILCNPVQFQASLRLAYLSLTRKAKEKVWKVLWNTPGVKESLLNRLLNYRPHVIINACTTDCKEEIGTFLEERRDCFQCRCHVYEAAHPSSIDFKERRDFCYRICLGQ